MPALPKRTLQELRAFIELHGNAIEHKRWLPQIDRALKGSPKRRAFKASQKKARLSKRETKNLVTGEIHYRVFNRARDLCELCRFRPPEEMHHAFGRVRVHQSERNCLALCGRCHLRLTRNKPDAVTCWLLVAKVFDRLWLTDSAELARGKADWHASRKGAA